MISRQKLNQFFVDIKDTLSDEPLADIEPKIVSKAEGPLEKNVCDEEGQQRTNVIYLNTDCNLRCEYCYEDDSRNGLPDQANLTPDKIDEFLQEICQREPEVVSTIVIMGGEPFLRFDLVEYIVAKCIQLSNKKWGITSVTNGTLFTPEILVKLKNLLDSCSESRRVTFSLEVSYDGSGHHRRKWPDESSSISKVEQGIDKLVEHEIPFRMSYTVHKDNYNNAIEDTIKIFERWPIKRLSVSFAYQDLDETFGNLDESKKFVNHIREYYKELYNIYNIPICGLVCDECGICYKSNFSGNSYLSPTTGVSYDTKESSHPFKQF